MLMSRRRVRARTSCVLSNCWPSFNLVENLVDTIFEVLQEQSRLKITNELRRYIEVGNHEPVKIGDLALWTRFSNREARDQEKNSEAIKVFGPNLNREMFPDAAVRDGAEELRIDTSKR